MHSPSTGCSISLGFRAIFLVLLALWPIRLVAQSNIPADQQPAVKAIVKFIRDFEGDAKANAVLAGFENKSIRIAPVPEDDIADTNPDTHVITLNPKLLVETCRFKDGRVVFKGTADWAATINHELVHAKQDSKVIIASNLGLAAGMGCPHEVAGWRAGFQSYYDWMDSLRRKLESAKSEADRVAVALQLRDLVKGFNEYRQNYRLDFGAMWITGQEQVQTDLNDAAEEVQRLGNAANAVLNANDFVVTTKPGVQTVKKGESFTVAANPWGGEFDKNPDAPDRLEKLYTYVWSADGARLVGLTGPRITRMATKSETITVHVTDKLARKRSGTCKITVEEPKVKKASITWGSLPSGWTVSNGYLANDRANLLAGAGERGLVDNPQFGKLLNFRLEDLRRATNPTGYNCISVVEVSGGTVHDYSSQEKIDAAFTDSKGRKTTGYQGTKWCQFQGIRALRYDVGAGLKWSYKEWGYFIELDPSRNLWCAIMCHVEATRGGRNVSAGYPSDEDQMAKKLELEKNVERLLEKSIHINFEPSAP